MSINYFPDCDKYLKNLYSINSLWFEARHKLKQKDLKKLFDLFLDISLKLEDIKEIINKEE